MKKELLLLLKANPATAGRPDDFLDTLAEDIQAAIIRAIIPAPYEDQTLLIEQDYFRQGLYSESGEQAATLKRRLTDYALPMSTTIN